ncbi:hypothetical protein [Candidatus Burkholderia verschuerenii]|uniref:hypothetical protein n=1 Tax=Candidatus Burkholderia verschuerenii TaxID=242163 RepID=UPI0012EDCA89|nr:hypothetical protein [Candidatus Burkholderia verschuerenii]
MLRDQYQQHVLTAIEKGRARLSGRTRPSIDTPTTIVPLPTAATASVTASVAASVTVSATIEQVRR